MNIVVIEDEQLTAEDLVDTILRINPNARVVKILNSVKSAVEYFTHEPAPDLIFSDIQLGDGLSFDIFKTVPVKAPIIFCTAYDDYAIDAFKTNGIHYVLKPFDERAIQEAFQKLELVRKTSPARPDDDALQTLLKHFEQKPSKVSSVLVHYKDKIIPVKLSDVAVFYIRNEVTHLYTFDQRDYLINKTLDELEQLAGDQFFRANRQFIVNRNAIQNAAQYQSRKVSVLLKVPFTESILISKEKMTPFLEWLAQ
jgi:two-component system response regulator LytT